MVISFFEVLFKISEMLKSQLYQGLWRFLSFGRTVGTAFSRTWRSSCCNIKTRPTNEIQDFEWVPQNLVTRYARNMSSRSLLASRYSLLRHSLFLAVSATGGARKRPQTEPHPD